MKIRNKPHIELLKKEQCRIGEWKRVWRCHDNYFISGYGDTPKEAYEQWRELESRRSRIKRYGVWNKKSVMQWYYGGCRTIRFYVGLKQIIGYLPQTDELILRG